MDNNIINFNPFLETKKILKTAGRTFKDSEVVAMTNMLMRGR